MLTQLADEHLLQCISDVRAAGLSCFAISLEQDLDAVIQA